MNDFIFPKKFLWGTATSAYQVEGNNINSDNWLLEHLPGSIYSEPSGDACDHYHRYPSDIALLAELGFNAYRFSIEWARIEPEEGEFSYATLEHYRRMLATCHENGLSPMVTFHHFTSPRWLLRSGGWLDDKTPERFARYCERATSYLGDLITSACTINEANIAVFLARVIPFDVHKQGWWSTAAREFGIQEDQLGIFLYSPSDSAVEIILNAHRRAVDAIRASRGNFPVGLTLALPDIQFIEGGESLAAQVQRDFGDRYLETLHDDDLLGVQTYGRMVFGPDGGVPPPKGAELNQMGDEFYPEALEGSIRHAAKVAGIPILVTENGLASTDDTRRVAYIQRALRGVSNCLEAGIDIRGYFYWSTFDNFEWTFGYYPKFGLIEVDRQTQERTVKPSAKWLGAIARSNRLQI